MGLLVPCIGQSGKTNDINQKELTKWYNLSSCIVNEVDKCKHVNAKLTDCEEVGVSQSASIVNETSMGRTKPLVITAKQYSDYQKNHKQLEELGIVLNCQVTLI